jgi:hypothetical protein
MKLKITKIEKKNFTYLNEDSIATKSNLTMNQTKQMQDMIESSHIHKDNQFETTQ